MSDSRPVVVLLGPTSGGKTRLAMDLARRLTGGGECISADSMQVYRGMDIGTAKPTMAEQAEVRHHVLDVVESNDDSFSVDRWVQLAHSAIEQVRACGRWPILVGGTNLYVQAFMHGMMRGPEPDPALRRRLQSLPPEELRAWLVRVDPEAACRIHVNDQKRTIRAIEVYERSGTPISTSQNHWGCNTPDEGPSVDDSNHDTLVLGLDFPVEIINRRINSRVMQMIQAGFVAEVEGLHRAGKLGRNAREALGYKQIVDYIDGGCTLDEAIERIKIRTRRFAKQQRTWLRRFRNLPNSRWISADNLDAQGLVNEALGAIQSMACKVAGR